MIRLGKHEDINQIEILVSEAKDLMKSFGNNQWDDKYPTPEHFKADIDTKTLYVLEENNTIYGFIVVDQQQSEWYDNLEWPIDRNNAYVIHRLVGSKDYKGAATQLFDFAVKLAEEHHIHVILTCLLYTSDAADE